MSDTESKVTDAVDAVSQYVRTTEEHRFNCDNDVHNALANLYYTDPDEYRRQKSRMDTDLEKRDQLRALSAYQIKLEWFVVALKKGDADVESFDSQLKELRPRAEEALMFFETQELVPDAP